MPEMSIDERVDQLINCPARCAMLLIVEQERLEPRDLAKLETAFLVTGITEWSSQ